MTPWPPEHYTDWLTLPERGEYQQQPAAKRRRIRRALQARRYTRLVFSSPAVAAGRIGRICPFTNPHALLPYLDEVIADGLGPVLEIGLEGDREAQAKWPLQKFLYQLERFLPVVADKVADWKIGVEVEEWAGGPRNIRNVGELLHDFNQMTRAPIWVHFSTPADGVSPKRWWQHAVAYLGPTSPGWCSGPALQYPKRDKGHGFLAHPDDVRRWTTSIVSSARAAGYVGFLGDEYAYRRPEASAQALGKIIRAISAPHGFQIGIGNGVDLLKTT